jgi:hypothetical protein
MVLLAAATLRGRLRRVVWLLLLAALAADALAVGPEMRVAGHPLMTGVWTWLEQLPALGEALPIRLDMYAGLFLALAAALWLAQPGRRAWRIVLATLAVVAFVPSPSSAFWASHARQSRFFASAANHALIQRGDTALVFPYMHHSWLMLWQAETHFRFRLVGGHVGQAIIPSECRWKGDYESLGGGTPPGGPAGFRRFLLAHHVNVVVEGPGTSRQARQLIRSSLPDVPQVRVADATVLRLSGLSPSLPRDAPPLPPAPLTSHGPGVICR